MWRTSSSVGTLAWVGASVAMLAACRTPPPYRDALARYDRVAISGDDAVADDGRALFEDTAELTAEAVIAAALERNPGIEEARAGWRAALARVPQARSFEDPTLSYSFAPLSIASDEVDYGQVIQLSQRLPYPGKRRLRGEVALAEADAASHDYDAVRLRVARMAADLYYQLYAIERAIATNTEYEKELEQHRDALLAHLAAGHAWQDDALKVDIDLGGVTQILVGLEAERQVLVAQINELLHRAPERPLPALPATLPPPPPAPGSSAELQAIALQERPEVGAAAARIEREGAAIGAARREFFPDVRLTGTYNSMWAQLEHQLMFGVAVDLPVVRKRRRAAVREARARRERAAASAALVEDRIRAQVERARETYAAAREVVATYRDEIVPAAEDRVEAVRVALDTGRQTFVEVLRADHELLAVTLRYEQALAEAHRWRAELALAIGRLEWVDGEGGAP